MDKNTYRERTYRNRLSSHGLTSFHVQVRETDLYLAAQTDLTEAAYDLVRRYRSHLENYIRFHPEFRGSLQPLPEDPMAPEIVKLMQSAGKRAGVGPMAAVAGAMSEMVGRGLLKESAEVIVENGGDIYLDCQRDLHVGIFAGKSPLSGKLTLRVPREKMPGGICTSSATVGPSLSFGTADAVCVLSPSAALADAAASQIGNRVKTKADIQPAIDAGANIAGVTGIVIILKNHLGIWGDVEIE